MTPVEVLSRYWGYDSFRPMQAEIIDSVLAGHDTLGLLPTGGGKSVTFQVPAMILPGVTLVMTPLISLMKDQVDNLRDRGIRASLLHSGMSRREQQLALDRCRVGSAKLLYVSPEKLLTPSFSSELQQLKVSLLVVDEAHCISQWGYDFRPSYLKIGKLRTALGHGVPCLALTASATPEVTADIMTQLGFDKPRVLARSFARDNLSYIVRYDDYKEGKLLDVLEHTAGSSIVYVRSRKRAHDLADFLARNGISADYYHAGLTPEEKNERQNRWKADECRVIVATNAFGMGIDKPDVRYVVHFDLPSSLEEYYQEAGRAGRDGKPAFAVVIVSRSDKGTLTRRLNEAFPDREFIRHVYEMAGNFLDVAVGEGYNKVYEFNFALFCKRFELKAPIARNALLLLTRAGWLEYVDEVATRSRTMLLADKRELYGLQVDDVTDQVLQALLRSYTGLFADYVDINEGLIASRLQITTEQVYQSLLKLQREHILHYIPKRVTPYIYYTTSRELPKYVTLPKAVYEDQMERMRRRIEAMKSFAYDTDHCRVAGMLRYFGEKDPQPCGKCDVCRATAPRKRPSDHDAAAVVLAALRAAGPLEAVELASRTGMPVNDVIDVLRRLLADGTVVRTTSTTFGISK